MYGDDDYSQSLVVRCARPDLPAARRQLQRYTLRGITMREHHHPRGLRWLDAERLAQLLIPMIRAVAELIDALHSH